MRQSRESQNWRESLPKELGSFRTYNVRLLLKGLSNNNKVNLRCFKKLFIVEEVAIVQNTNEPLTIYSAYT